MNVLELNFMFSVQSLTKKVQDQFHNTTFTFTKSNTTRQHNLHRKFKTKFTFFSQTYNSRCKKCKCQYIIGEQQHFHSPQRKLMLRLFSSAQSDFLSTTSTIHRRALAAVFLDSDQKLRYGDTFLGMVENVVFLLNSLMSSF